MTLQSPTPTTVTIRYSLVGANITFRENGTLMDTINRTIEVNESRDVDLVTELVPRSGSGSSPQLIDVEIEDPGCGDIILNTSVVGL